MAQLAEAIQDLQVEQNIRYITWEGLFKPYSSSNSYRDTNFQAIGPIVPGSLEIPRPDTLLDEITGLPAGLKKTVLLEREATVKFTVHNTEDRIVDLANGGSAMVVTKGLDTTINDVSPAADAFTLTSATGLDTRALGYIKVTCSGVDYYAQVATISGNDITLVKPLPVTPTNGDVVQQVLGTAHSLNANTTVDVSLLLVGTDQNGDQEVYYLPRIRMELSGRPLINFGDGASWMSIDITGKSLTLAKTEQGGSKAVVLEHYQLSGDWKLTLGALTGQIAELNSEANVNVGVIELAWKELDTAAAYDDLDWRNLGIVVQGGGNPSFTRALNDKKTGIPKTIKISTPVSIMGELTAEMEETNPRIMEMVYAGNRLVVKHPGAMFAALTSGSSTTKIMQAATGNFTNAKIVTVKRAAGTLVEKRTLSAVTALDPSVTVSVALGGTPADGDIVEEGVWQLVDTATVTPTTTKVAVDSAADFAAGDDIVAMKATGTTVATSALNDNTHIVVADATGLATGGLVRVVDLTNNKAEFAFIKEGNGTLLTLEPGLSFTPANGDLVRQVFGFSRIHDVDGATLNLSEPLDAAPAANDYIGRLDDVAVTSSGSTIREISLRVTVSTEDRLKQFVIVIPRFRLKQTGSPFKHPDAASANYTAMLMGNAISQSATFNSVAVVEAARLHILRGTEKITA